MKIIVIIVIILVLVAFTLCYKNENFWGGYMRVPYVGQRLVAFNRSGLDAATDNPRMIVNVNSCAINPYCVNKKQCSGYRCCC